MAWFQWRKCGNMIPNVQHQLYQLYNRHWTQPYHEYQTSHVISNPVVVGGFYWFYSPLFWMANHPSEILETPREAASSLEGNLAAGLWSFGECSSESRGEQGSWGLVGWYGFTLNYPQFLWQLNALLMGKLTTCREFEVTLGLLWDFGVPHFPNSALDVEAICSKLFQFFFINVIHISVIHNKKSIIPNSRPFVIICVLIHYIYIIISSK